MKRYLLILFLIVAFSHVHADGVIVIKKTGNVSNLNLEKNLFYFIDTFNQYSFNDVLDESFDKYFIQAESPNFFYNSQSFTQWYKLVIENFSDESQELILGLNNPMIQNLTIFSSVDSVFYSTGALSSYDQRQYDYKNFLYEISLSPGQSATYCIKVLGQEQSLYVPISLDYKEIFIQKLKNSQFWNGVFYTLVILILLFVSILWNSERERFYFILLLFVVVLFLLKLWRDDILFELLWPNSPVFNHLTRRALLPLVIVFVLLFANQYYRIVKIGRRIKRLFVFTIVSGVVFSLVQYLSISAGLYLAGIRVLTVAYLIFIVLGMIDAYNKGYKHFLAFTSLFTVLAAYILLVVIFRFDIRGVGFFDEDFLKVLLSIYFIIIGAVFISKFNYSRSEVILLNKNLEQLVEKRTSQLNAQKEELKAQHEEMIMQKETLQTQREELRAQKELLEMKNQELEKLSLVASKTNNLIYIFTPDGLLDWYNSSFALVIGKTYEEYKHGDPLNIVDISMNKNIRHVLNTCLREKTVVSYESVLAKDTNDKKWYHTTLTPILDDNDEVRLLIAIDTDISRLKQFEEELNDQRKDAEMQKVLAIQRKEELEERQIEITDSIRYAKRIQTAIMPKVKQIQRDFPESFVLFLPKDIVSGDFYWYHRVGNKLFIAAVDCTGHGVPGAFMSIIGNYLLNSIIIHNGISDPAEILKQLNRKIKIALKADGRAQTSDGMDISLAVVDKEENTLEYAGALRPLYLFHEGNFFEAKGDKIPITSNISGITISSFKTQRFECAQGDVIYMFSDGIIDQFGGDKGKKFLTKRFKQLLFDINDRPMTDQKEIIKKSFDDWKQDNEQVDDILVMGIRF